MSRIERVILLDDLANDDTTEADETVPFSLDGVDYEIDLTEANAQKLRARLKEFTQAGRIVPKRRRSPRPMTEPAGAGATLSRHQGGVDPKAARAWATEHRLIAPKQRGVLGKKIKDAYSAFQRGDTGPLNELKAELATDGTTPATDKPNTPQQPPKRRALAAVPEPAPSETPTAPNEDPDEVEARKHYKPLDIRSPEMADDKKWRRRTAHGCDRTDKVEQMTYAERVRAVGGGLSNRNVTILAQLAGVIEPKNGKISHLTGSALRLQNLEMIEYVPESDHGWEITDFGRYAHQFHSMGE
ncbi:Lsr2 family protein [Streptomyces sp. NPDC006265]|uniref:histone-like nucleoid-structuring protein Lsr2 n=1 Tax=Streptomyces sp. NPDC006265 TaxID=3156740 RepID=UPI0033A055E4